MHQGQLTVAVLGPLGTYTHQAAYGRFGSSVQYHECGTITDVFNVVASQVAHAGVVPQENSTFGSVIETYDALRRENIGTICGEILLEVQHCLLVRRGVKREDIRYIKSHEQALGQCRDFLAQHFPSAALEKVGSTAAAAKAVSTSDDCAAICSKVCATVFSDLEIMFEGIQDRNNNYTRFYVVSAALDELPSPVPIPRQTRCLVRLSSAKGNRPSPIMQLLSALGMNIARLDRRPQLDTTLLFSNIYFAELERGELGDEPWMLEIQCALQRVQDSGGDAQLMGIW
ncbi:Prephenate dehydratase-domain-containing protein [Mycena belliarum]|uniref:prephenate dehydratase n=1 Tax=Mycena belliarum TaxID=1033014 RepID=A0AAD6UIN7_9AGAR|nr:Prephenate dehydratase-domain-containing protein [Mycena belliae]